MTAYGLGISAVVDAVFQLGIGGFDWVAGSASGLVAEGLGVIITLATTAWSLALSPLQGTDGLLVPALALAVALVYLYLLKGGDG
jgi:hypothetical protein